jgi:hypothetical protein
MIEVAKMAAMDMALARSNSKDMSTRSDPTFHGWRTIERNTNPDCGCILLAHKRLSAKGSSATVSGDTREMVVSPSPLHVPPFLKRDR